MWLDEKSVFKSLELYQPQDFFTRKLQVDQMFPRVYLWGIQQVAKPFELNVWGVRLLPFVSMLLAFGVWFKVAQQALKDRRHFLLFCLCWTASVPLIYYSAELKQYSMDVLASGIFMLFLYRQNELARRLQPGRYRLVLASLPLLGLFSYPAFLFFIFVFCGILRTERSARDRGTAAFVFFCAALAVLVFVLVFDVRLSATSLYQGIWTDYFVSFQSAGMFFKTWGEGTINLFSRWFTEQPRWLRKTGILFVAPAMVYIPYAFCKSIRRHGIRFDSVETVAFVLYLEQFLLAVLQKYPLGVPRTSLFFCPFVFLMAIKGMAALPKQAAAFSRTLQFSFFIFLLFVSAGIAREVVTQPLNAIHPVWSQERTADEKKV